MLSFKTVGAIASLLVAGSVLSVVATPTLVAQGSYATVKWNNPKLSATGDATFCLQTGLRLARSNSRATGT